MMSMFDCEVEGCKGEAERHAEAVVLCKTFPMRLCINHRRQFEKECQASPEHREHARLVDEVSVEMAALYGGSGGQRLAAQKLAKLAEAREAEAEWAWAWYESHTNKVKEKEDA